jgi:hypothetical protein
MWLISAVLPVVLTGCGGPTRFVDPEADMPYYQNVGIIPFSSLAGDRAAGLRVTDLFFSELLRTGFATVVEPGQFAAAMSKARGGGSPEKAWSTEELLKLKELTGVQAVFMGTVRDYSMERERMESFPLVSMEARLVDTETGGLIWSASRTRKGGPGFPILGFWEVRTLGQLGADVCHELLNTLPRSSVK